MVGGNDVIRVVMADDHTRLRARIRVALESDGCVVCAEGATALEGIDLAKEHRPDVALLDIHMPGGGVNAAQQITRDLPDTVVVMLTSSRDDEDLFDSLRAGASGYLLKDMDPADLPAALRGVLAGEAAMPPSLVARVLREFQVPNRRLRVTRSAAAMKLTDREREVMEHLGLGKSTEEVAMELFVSATTVRVHVSAVLRKLRVKDRKSAFKLLSGD